MFHARCLVSPHPEPDLNRRGATGDSTIRASIHRSSSRISGTAGPGRSRTVSYWFAQRPFSPFVHAYASWPGSTRIDHCCMILHFPKAEVECQSFIALAMRRKPQADTRCQTGKMRRSERSPPEKVFHHSDNVCAAIFMKKPLTGAASRKGNDE